MIGNASNSGKLYQLGIINSLTGTAWMFSTYTCKCKVYNWKTKINPFVPTVPHCHFPDVSQKNKYYMDTRGYYM